MINSLSSSYIDDIISIRTICSYNDLKILNLIELIDIKDYYSFPYGLIIDIE